MCLAIPGKIISIYFVDGDLKMAKVSFNGVIKEVCVEWLPDVEIGDYILAHAGTAINIIDEKEAKETLQIFKEWEKSLEEEDNKNKI